MYIPKMKNRQKRTRLFDDFVTQILPSFTTKAGVDSEGFARILFGRFEMEDERHKEAEVYARAKNYWQTVVIPHKIAVYEAGVQLYEQMQSASPEFVDKTAFLQRLIYHDLSKFSAAETYGYMNFQFGGENASAQKKDFELAWHHHKHHNSHHPEYWFSVNKKGETNLLPMSKMDCLEMVADWLGAGKSYGGDFEVWVTKNIGNFSFHPTTKVTLAFIFETMELGNIIEFI